MGANLKDLERAHPLQWKVAVEWAKLFDSHVQTGSLSETACEKIVYEMGASRATVRNKFKVYLEHRTVSSLLPKKPGPEKGATYLADKIEEQIQKGIEFYKTMERPSMFKTWEHILELADEQTRDKINYKTVQRRINAHSRKSKELSRLGKKVYDSKHARASQRITADYPLQKVQIDHTKVDLMVVDEDFRLSIGRPWLTALIDVYSRMILGFYFDFRNPSTWSVSECLNLAVFEKSGWLKQQGINLSWPCQGIPELIMSDKAKEFESKAFAMGCAEYGIKHETGKAGKANLRGTVERVFGTFNNEFHNLPGTTFSNVQQRLNYDSEGRAIFTLKELTHYFGVYVLGRYHREKHSRLGASPVDVWNDAISSGFTPRKCLQDPNKFRVDFIKSENKKVTREGVRHLYEFFWSGTTQAICDFGDSYVRVYPFHNDISKILIRDEHDDLHVVPNSNPNRHSISWAELKAIQKADKRFENSGLSIDERVEQTRRERALVDKSAKLTKSTRRKNQIDKSKQSHPLRNISSSEHKGQKLNSKPVEKLKFKAFDVIGGEDD